MPSSILPDQFYNKPLATAVREVLEMRKRRPATSQEIHAALKTGGFAFESRDDENAMRGMAVSISKNTALFARLPNGLIGLNEWYGGGTKRKKQQTKENGASAAASTVIDELSADESEEQEGPE